MIIQGVLIHFFLFQALFSPSPKLGKILKTQKGLMKKAGCLRTWPQGHGNRGPLIGGPVIGGLVIRVWATWVENLYPLPSIGSIGNLRCRAGCISTSSNASEEIDWQIIVKLGLHKISTRHCSSDRDNQVFEPPN